MTDHVPDDVIVVSVQGGELWLSHEEASDVRNQINAAFRGSASDGNGFSVGDSDILPPLDDEQSCRASSEYLCCLALNHSGQHVATDGLEVIEVWRNEACRSAVPNQGG